MSTKIKYTPWMIKSRDFGHEEGFKFYIISNPIFEEHIDYDLMDILENDSKYLHKDGSVGDLCGPENFFDTEEEARAFLQMRINQWLDRNKTQDVFITYKNGNGERHTGRVIKINKLTVKVNPTYYVRSRIYSHFAVQRKIITLHKKKNHCSEPFPPNVYPITS